MAKNVENLIMGVGSLYIADFGTAEPLAADINEEPGVGWEDVGYTQDGVTLSFTQEYEELAVDQIVDIPGRRLTARSITLSTNLAEPTLKNLNLVLNGSGVENDNAWELTTSQGNIPQYKALLFDGYGAGGDRRRVIIRRALQIGDVEAVYAKDQQSVWSVEFAAHYVSESISPIYIADGLPTVP